MLKCKAVDANYAAEQAQKWREVYDVNAAEFKAYPEVHKATVLRMAAEFGAGLDGDEDLSACYGGLMAYNCIRLGLKLPVSNGEFVAAIKKSGITP